MGVQSRGSGAAVGQMEAEGTWEGERKALLCQTISYARTSPQGSLEGWLVSISLQPEGWPGRPQKTLTAQAASEALKQGQEGAGKSGLEASASRGVITPVLSDPTGPGQLPCISGHQNQPQIVSDQQPLK